MAIEIQIHKNLLKALIDTMSVVLEAELGNSDQFKTFHENNNYPNSFKDDAVEGDLVLFRDLEFKSWECERLKNAISILRNELIKSKAEGENLICALNRVRLYTYPRSDAVFSEGNIDSRRISFDYSLAFIPEGIYHLCGVLIEELINSEF